MQLKKQTTHSLQLLCEILKHFVSEKKSSYLYVHVCDTDNECSFLFSSIGPLLDKRTCVFFPPHSF